MRPRRERLILFPAREWLFQAEFSREPVFDLPHCLARRLPGVPAGPPVLAFRTRAGPFGDLWLARREAVRSAAAGWRAGTSTVAWVPKFLISKVSA